MRQRQQRAWRDSLEFLFLGEETRCFCCRGFRFSVCWRIELERWKQQHGPRPRSREALQRPGGRAGTSTRPRRHQRKHRANTRGRGGPATGTRTHRRWLPQIRPASDMVWCGARYGRSRRGPAPPGSRSPATLCTLVVWMDSANVRSGRIPAKLGKQRFARARRAYHKHVVAGCL